MVLRNYHIFLSLSSLQGNAGFKLQKMSKSRSKTSPRLRKCPKSTQHPLSYCPVSPASCWLPLRTCVSLWDWIHRLSSWCNSALLTTFWWGYVLLTSLQERCTGPFLATVTFTLPIKCYSHLDTPIPHLWFFFSLSATPSSMVGTIFSNFDSKKSLEILTLFYFWSL